MEQAGRGRAARPKVRRAATAPLPARAAVRAEGPPPAPDKVLVIACGMLACEILAIRQQMGLEHLVLKCLPAELHFHPQRIAAAVDAAIVAARAEGYCHIFVGYADCGSGGMLDKVLARQGVARLAGPHCFAVYQGAAAFAAVADADVTAFYMTDFLCRQFDAFFVRPLGLDRHPELARDFFGNYRKVVYLAQTEDPALEQVARDAAAMLGLAYESRLTRYGDLAPALQAAALRRGG
ncbi:DUF1638 domain-containing protein [Paracoccus sp. N5]|uniref:DUF1638 domain-containing protein n=1 Tax=Paracoccus sp. N5 TaxID=1101189 RepID=UPI00036AD186|nr:DUF1638 domain-containing protein [Paracoccus sp. N5]